jgi:hypothetical protein
MNFYQKIQRILTARPSMLSRFAVLAGADFTSGYFHRSNRFYLALPVAAVFSPLAPATRVTRSCATAFFMALGSGCGGFYAAILGIRADMTPFQA